MWLGWFSVIVVFSLCALWWRRIRDLWKLPDGRDRFRGKLGLVLMGRAKLSKSLIFCWWVDLCSLPVIYLGPNYGGDNEDNGDLLQKIPCMYCYTQYSQPCRQPPLTHTSAGDSWTLTGKSGSVFCFSPNQFINANVISVWFLNSFSMILDFECELKTEDIPCWEFPFYRTQVNKGMICVFNILFCTPSLVRLKWL